MSSKEDNKLTGRGGAGRNQGRKPSGEEPRKQPTQRVSKEARDNILKIAIESGHKPGDVLDWVMKNPKRLPKKL